MYCSSEESFVYQRTYKIECGLFVKPLQNYATVTNLRLQHMEVTDYYLQKLFVVFLVQRPWRWNMGLQISLWL